MSKVVAALLAVGLATAPIGAGRLHVHAAAGHDHPEHQHGPALHAHPHLPAGYGEHERTEIEACSPDVHVVAVSLEATSSAGPDLELVRVASNGATPPRPVTSRAAPRDQRAHGPPRGRAGPSRAPPARFPA